MRRFPAREVCSRRFPPVSFFVMDDSDENLSDHESVHCNDDSDYELNSEDGNIHVGGNGNGPGSSEDEIDDETLFKCFKIIRRMSKSVERNIGNVGTHSGMSKNIKAQHSKGNSDVGPSKATSRCSPSYFRDIIWSLDQHKRDVVTLRGFGSLLEYDGCRDPRNFVQWLADQVYVNCGDIHVSGKVIPMSSLSVNKVLGIPFGGRNIAETGESGESELLKKFNATSIPVITFFGLKILLKDEMFDDQFFRCFMVVALSTFLCLNSSTYPSPKYFFPLIESGTVDEWDWSTFVYDKLFDSIKKYKEKKRKILGGCIYLFAVYYLDFLQFGSHIHIASTIPRIKVWKDKMIKIYSSFDRVAGNTFGKCPVKNIEDTCYAPVPYDRGARFRQSLEERFDNLPEYNQDVGNVGLDNEVPHEASVTEKIESHGTYDGSGCNNCASQATVILSSDDSTCPHSGVVSSVVKNKRKRNTSSPESNNFVASRTRRRLAAKIGKSPLSEASSPVASVDDICHRLVRRKNVKPGEKGSKKNPLVIEEAPVSLKNDNRNHTTIIEALDEVARKHVEYNRAKQSIDCPAKVTSVKSPVAVTNQFKESTPHEVCANPNILPEAIVPRPADPIIILTPNYL